MTRALFEKELAQCLWIRLAHRLSRGKRFQHAQSGWPAGISEDLGEFWEKHHQKGVDLILVAGDLLRELLVQSHHFTVGGYLFTWHIAKACFPTEQGSCDGGSIQPIGFCAQT